MTARERTGPLDGLRVIDMSGMISGAFATTMMGDFGADVVMVEHPETGDPIREWPQKTEKGESLAWKSLGRNKRCITLDLGSERGREIALLLIEDADVVFENFRPGTMERWGLGPDDVHAVNEEAIMVRLSGYGQTGPKSQKPGFGTIAEGISGWAHANGFPDSEPLLPPISLADLTAAQFAMQATMMAIFERDVGRGGSGEGQVIDVSLIEPLWRLFFGEVEAYDRMGHVRERTGNQHPSTAPRNIYETADGYMTMSASNQKIFERVAEAIDKPELIEDPASKTTKPASRTTNRSTPQSRNGRNSGRPKRRPTSSSRTTPSSARSTIWPISSRTSSSKHATALSRSRIRRSDRSGPSLRSRSSRGRPVRWSSLGPDTANTTRMSTGANSE